MAKQTLSRIQQVSGKGISETEFVKRINENFTELYVGGADFEAMDLIADATDAASVLTKFNELLAALKSSGLMKSV